VQTAETHELFFLYQGIKNLKIKVTLLLYMLLAMAFEEALTCEDLIY